MKDTRRRRGIVLLRPREVEYMIELPDDLRIVTFFGDPKTNAVGIIVEGDSLQPVEDCAEPPVINASITQNVRSMVAVDDVLQYLPQAEDGVAERPKIYIVSVPSLEVVPE